MYKHYIRVDTDGNVTHAFSDAFEQPRGDEILVTKDGGRHFNLNIWYNGIIPRWQVFGDEMTERTDLELLTLWERYQALHPPGLTEYDQLLADNAALLLELVQIQTRQDQAEKDQAAILLSLVEGGVL